MKTIPPGRDQSLPVFRSIEREGLFKKSEPTNKTTDPKPGVGTGPENVQDDCWLDKQDILTRLHISSRTLQRWRKKGIISFARIGKKIFYKESDLKKIFLRHQSN